MLNIQRGVDIDAVVEDFLDIEIALWVPAPGSIRVRELVDEDELWTPRQNGVDVHFIQLAIFVIDALAEDRL